VIRITVSSPESSYIQYTHNIFFQYVINLTVRFPPIMRSPVNFNVLSTTRIFDAVKFTTHDTLSLLSSCQLSFPAISFKIPYLPQDCIKISEQNFHMVLSKITAHLF
jgi:hypothetical protein